MCDMAHNPERALQAFSRMNNIAPNTLFEGISSTIVEELIPSKQPHQSLELSYHSLSHSATSGAK
jgi:hypothetical protein